jgi:hypothetical protein
MAPRSVTNPNPCGPIAAPAIRYPTILPNPSRRDTGTAKNVAANNMTKVRNMADAPPRNQKSFYFFFSEKEESSFSEKKKQKTPMP